MKQREIWLADLNPSGGSEQKGIRPVVVISGNAMNDHLGIGIVCLLSTRIKHYAGCIIVAGGRCSGLEKDSEILTFQIRTVAASRFIRKLGEITTEQLTEVKQGLFDILTY